MNIFTLRQLQELQPWTVPYSEDFERSRRENPRRQVTHDVLHVMKSLGRIAADCEASDHGKPGKLRIDSLSREVADLVICALHIATTEGFDLHDAVVNCMQVKNGVTL